MSQKDLEKALNESGDILPHTNLNKFKTRIEFVGDFGDFEDVKKIAEMIKSLAKKDV